MNNCDSDKDGQYESSQKRLAKTLLRKKVFTFCSKTPKITPTSSRQTLAPTESSRSEVFSAVRRVVFWCVMCIISDITTVTVALMNGPGTPLILITALNNVNIVVNVLCLIATYSRWGNIFWPFRWRKNYEVTPNLHRNFWSSMRFSASPKSSRRSLRRSTLQRSCSFNQTSTLKRSLSFNQTKNKTINR